MCLQHRAESVVPGRMVEMIEAVQRKDFPAFAELTMKDSNQFHATCLDTYPPIFYLSSVSHQVISLVHRYNSHYGETRVSNLTVLFLRKRSMFEIHLNNSICSYMYLSNCSLPTFMSLLLRGCLLCETYFLRRYNEDVKLLQDFSSWGTGRLAFLYETVGFCPSRWPILLMQGPML